MVLSTHPTKTEAIKAAIKADKQRAFYGVAVFKHTEGWCVITDNKRKPGDFTHLIPQRLTDD